MYNAFINQMRTQSHKSLQCEVESRRDLYDVDERPTKLQNQELSTDNILASMSRSQDNIHERRLRSKRRSPIDRSPSTIDRRNKYCSCQYPRGTSKYPSKFDLAMSRTRMTDDRYRQYIPNPDLGRPEYDQDLREYRDFDDRRVVPTRDRRNYNEHRCEQKTSRSFDVHRDYVNDERNRRTSRSDSHRRRLEDCRDLREPRDKRYEDLRDLREAKEKKFDDRREKYFDENYERQLKDRHHSNLPSRDQRSRRTLDRCDRNSMVSRDDDYIRERDRYSERERDSGLSVADGDTSTISGRSNYLKVVKVRTFKFLP